MHFKLDRNDVLQDAEGFPLYRVIASEPFFAVKKGYNGLLCDIVTIRPGTKGGYAGSEYCLEETFDTKLKPWIEFPACISTGSVLTGACTVSGDTKISGESVVESGSIITGGSIIRSHIKPEKYAVKDRRILASVLVSGKTRICDSVFHGSNIKIHSSDLVCCRADACENISLINSELDHILFSNNIGVTDTILNGDEEFSVIPAESVYKNGEWSAGIPENMMVRINKSPYTHKEAYDILTEQVNSPKGIYRNVEYRPVF